MYRTISEERLNIIERKLDVSHNVDEWKEKFRMSTGSTCKELCEDLRPLLGRKSTRMRRPIWAETHIVVALYYLSSEGRYRKLANAFRISRSSVSIIVRRDCAAISEYLGPTYARLPTSERQVQKLDSQFHVYHGFPQCMGAHWRCFWLHQQGYRSVNVQATWDRKSVV